MLENARQNAGLIKLYTESDGSAAEGSLILEASKEINQAETSIRN